MKVSDIKPAPYNPRTISEFEQKGLSTSIDKFGNIADITWNKHTGNLIAGHQRWNDLQSKGEVSLDDIGDNIYKIYINGEFSTFLLRVVEWDKATEKAANVTANSHTIAGKFDTEILSTLLEDIKEFDDNLYNSLNMDILKHDLRLDDTWESDIEAIDKVKENLDGIEATIKITCSQDDKDAVLIYLKDKLMETSFEGVHIA